MEFYGINFSPGAETIRIHITSEYQRRNNGEPIVIEFTPGEQCQFGDGTACTSAHPGVLNGHTIFITIHSGIGGEGQAFRNSIEGTGFDRARFSLEEITSNLKNLHGAQVTVFQGNRVLVGLTLSTATRIPATAVREYFELPIPQALDLAGELDQSMSSYLHPEQPQIIFETCGWVVPGESGAKEVSPTTGSVYLGVIQ